MPTPRKELRARHGIERRALTQAEKDAGYIGAIRSLIPYDPDSGEIRERGTNKGVAFVERVAPGAFKRSLENPGDIMAFAGHTDDPLSSLARAGAGLTFTETATGLQWEALAPDTAACRDLVKLVESGVIKGASFEFSVRGKDGERWESAATVATCGLSPQPRSTRSILWRGPPMRTHPLPSPCGPGPSAGSMPTRPATRARLVM